jgi:hypothetical protein
LAQERGDLDALRRGPQSIAVDHRVAEHHRADTGSTEHQPVDRDTSGLIGVRLDGRRLMKDSIGRFTHGEISHDAAAAAMDQRFAGTGQTGNQRLDCSAMIAAGRIDDSLGRPGFGLQQRRVIKRSNDCFDAVRCNRVRLRLAANEPANPMAGCDKG